MTPLLISLAVSVLPLAAAPEPRLLAPGTYHEGEVAPGSAGAWWALCLDGEGPALTPVEVEVTPAFDEMTDTPTAEEVQAEGCTHPLVLLRAPGLRAGPLTQAQQGPQTDFVGSRSLRLGGRTYRLEAELEEARLGVRLTEGGHTQALYTTDAGDDPHWELVWAGDLDGDGALDLVLEAAHHYNRRTLRLFLSSAAHGEELLGEVARFSQVGC